MRYQSTRDRAIGITSAEAIAQGLSRDGGLFVPEVIPELPPGVIAKLAALPYVERAASIMKMFLDDYTEDELLAFAKAAYGMPVFDDPKAAPVRKVDDETYCLELWHGPTSAFKDMALQMLPHLLTAALAKTGEKKDVCILVATSGDTGKAALEGFRDVPHTKIMVFYPEDGVSDVQKLQMTTQEGGNVGVCAVYGNFDDAQTGVKKIFSDEAMRKELAEKGVFLSSANSINWGRLLPQIVYYISAYCDLVSAGAVKEGEEIDFCVPTGNFGNILAGYYAKKMGLPVGRLICASNTNDVLTQFIKTGVYDRNRPFATTISPSMDILISSNLERLLYDVSGRDDKLIGSYMRQLQEDGKYKVSDKIFSEIQSVFKCGSCSDEKTLQTIREVYDGFGYLIDTHTAVAFAVLEDLRRESGGRRKTVVVSTASPYKFCDSVLAALGGDAGADGLDLIDRLEEKTGTKAPYPLKSLRGKAVRFTQAVKKEEMPDVVRRFLS
jgi:threonine synthase